MPVCAVTVTPSLASYSLPQSSLSANHKITHQPPGATIVRSMPHESIYFLAIAIVAVGFALAPNVVRAQQQAANTTPAPPATDATLNNAAQKGLPLTTTSNVSDEASIQAVLIPASLARKIFGKEVSQNYAVVEVIVSNRDANASLVLHSVFLDYSNWLLSGTTTGSRTSPTGLDPTQAATNTSQVASIESRLVRGELLDAQQWTARNWTMRTLAAVGTVAVGFEFPFSSSVTQGIGAFNGVVVPGAATLWPDGTVNQINRISDFGFQTNKIIPKESSDILVAFFPIDRFLTDTFRNEFLKNPAGWFVPYELLADPKTEPGFEKIVGPLADGLLAKIPDEPTSITQQTPSSGSAGDATSAKNSVRAKMLKSMLASCGSASSSSANTTPDAKSSTSGVPASPAPDEDPDCKLKKLINAVSLNNLHVVIEGIMTVDVTTVPATVYSVDFQSGNKASIWTTLNTPQSGSITGVYLTGGVPAVVDRNNNPISGVTITPVATGSTDSELNFTMTLAQCIEPGPDIHFVVNKSQSAAQTNFPAAATPPRSSATATAKPVASMPYEFTVQPSSPCPAVGSRQGAATTPPVPAANTNPAP